VGYAGFISFRLSSAIRRQLSKIDTISLILLHYFIIISYAIFATLLRHFISYADFHFRHWLLLAPGLLFH